MGCFLVPKTRQEVVIDLGQVIQHTRILGRQGQPFAVAVGPVPVEDVLGHETLIVRVDFRLDRHDNNKPYVLEINPLPGLNPRISDLVIEARAEGVSHAELINTILLHAAVRQKLLPRGMALEWPAVQLPASEIW